MECKGGCSNGRNKKNRLGYSLWLTKSFKTFSARFEPPQTPTSVHPLSPPISSHLLPPPSPTVYFSCLGLLIEKPILLLQRVSMHRARVLTGLGANELSVRAKQGSNVKTRACQKRETRSKNAQPRVASEGAIEVCTQSLL